MAISEGVRDGLIAAAYFGGYVLSVIAIGTGVRYLLDHMVPLAATVATDFLAVNSTSTA